MDEQHTKSAIEAFATMWENYPSPVMLLTKKQEIVSLNKIARDYGLTPGITCYSLLGRNRTCADCKAALALKEKAGMRNVAYNEITKSIRDTFWIPVNGNSDLYIHFANDISAYAKPELFPKDE